MSTITFNCTKCGQAMRVGADKAGRKAKCTKCATILTIPAAEEVLDEVEVVAGPPKRDAGRSRRDDDDDDRPRSRRDDEDDYDDDRPRKRGRYDEDDGRPKKDKTNWGKVAVGALINKIGAIIVFVGIALYPLSFLLGFIAGMARSPVMLTLAGVVILIAGIAILCGYIAVLVGHCFFLGLAKKHGWGLALTSLILLGSLFLFGFISMLGTIMVAPILMGICSIICGILAGVHMILIGLTFAKVGQARDGSLERRGRTVMIFGCTYLGYGVLAVIITIIIGAVSRGGAGAGIVVLVVGAIGYGITAGMYLSFMLGSFLFRSVAAD
jgi:hypothetical protein